MSDRSSQTKSSNPLAIVLSCRKNEHLWRGILEKNINNLIIFCGDPELKTNYLYKNKIIYLKCEDTYDHLPTKMYMVIQAILDIDEFSSITHIFKFDDHDTLFNSSLIDKIKGVVAKNLDYGGQKVHHKNKKMNSFRGDNKWHYNKCPKSSIWYNKPYLGAYAPWCDGGCGYILSRKSMNLIKNSLLKSEIYINHIYEDLMIGIVLYDHNIHPIETGEIIVGDK